MEINQIEHIYGTNRWLRQHHFARNYLSRAILAGWTGNEVVYAKQLCKLWDELERI